MRVLFINTVAGSGSVGRIVTGLSSALKERGNDSLIAYGRGNIPQGFNSYRIGSDMGIYLHGILCRINDRHGLYSAGATKRLIEKIREYDPDIIHIHNVHGYYVNYRLLFAFLKNEYASNGKKRIIWTLHDCWSFTGHCVHFEYARCDRWKEACHDCPEKLQYPKSLILDNSRENYRLKKEAFTGIDGLTLVTPSVWLKGKLNESFLCDYPVEVVPTGIDLSVFKRQENDIRGRYGIGDKTLLLGAANPWRERKGFDDFIKLSQRLSDKACIAMIGLSKAQKRALSDCKNIIPIIKTDSVREMAEWYSAANIYVNLTYEDTFPTTNIEALACGTPVISYRAGGSPEALTADTGKVVEIGNISGVINAVDELLKRDREKTADACTARAAEYGADVRFRQYLEEVYGL